MPKKGYKQTQQHKKTKWSFQKGSANPNYRQARNKGIPQSKKTKQKISKAGMGDKNSNWRGGIWHNSYSVDWTDTLKRSIRERDHYICQLCGKYGYVIHHIDYDKKNCDPKNLVTLCRGCHTKTNYNREYWIDYFR